MDVARLHQAGITYAVATLGTATTPEHLRRIFRLVNEVVFCFDGDKAGRAAAWRALGKALPEARDGRQIRFLFLPEGHDPDSLVGEEGRGAFEKRLEGALPLSEYLRVGARPSRPIFSHADGRASSPNWPVRWSPRWRRASIGTCSIDRIGGVDQAPSARLNQLWFNEVTGDGGNHLAPGAPTCPRSARREPVTHRGARDGGGGKGWSPRR